MRGGTKFVVLGLAALVAVGASVVGAWGGGSPPRRAAADPASTVLVLRGESLHDLARLLRPMSFSGGPGLTLNLRDAVYAGAAGGRARVLSVWLAQGAAGDQTLLTSEDAARPTCEVADALAQGPLAGAAFAVIGLDVYWRDWTLHVARTNDAVVKGPSGSLSQLRAAINASPLILQTADTRSVGAPIGLGQTMQTAMQPWFETDQVVVQMRATPAGAPSASAPDVSALGGQGGLIVGDGFINNIFSNQLQHRLFGGGEGQNRFTVRDLRFTSTAGRLTVSGRYNEAPPPATVRIEAVFEGADLGLARVGAQSIECSTLPALQCAGLRAKVNVGGVFVTQQHRGRALRPEGAQLLGNFVIGTKLLNGTSRFERIQAADGAAVLIGVFRLKGGQIS